MFFSNLDSNIFLYVKKASLVFGYIGSAFGTAESIGHTIFMDVNKITEKL